MWICTNIRTYDSFGYAYYDFHRDKPKNVFPYYLLKRKRLHNLEHYELIDKGKTLQDSSFKLKEDANIYKKGVTKEDKDIICIKITYNC